MTTPAEILHSPGRPMTMSGGMRKQAKTTRRPDREPMTPDSALRELRDAAANPIRSSSRRRPSYRRAAHPSKFRRRTGRTVRKMVLPPRPSHRPWVIRQPPADMI